jgi:hypothetical protein
MIIDINVVVMMMMMMMTTQGEGASQTETRDYSLIQTNTPEALFRFRFITTPDVRSKGGRPATRSSQLTI